MYSAVTGCALFHFSSDPVFTGFPSRYDIFAGPISVCTLSARCLQAEDDSGNYPSTLLLPEQFSCALAVSSEQQMKETCGDDTRCVGSTCSLSVCFSFDLEMIQVCLLSSLSSFSLSFRVWYVSQPVFLSHISSAASHIWLSLDLLFLLSTVVFLYPSISDHSLFHGPNQLWVFLVSFLLTSHP